MLLHGYLQQNKAVIGNFISLLCKNDIDTAETSVSTTRAQRVICIWRYRGQRVSTIFTATSCRFRVKNPYNSFGYYLEVLTSFMRTASHTVLPKLMMKYGIYCSTYLRFLMARGRREACRYRGP